MSTENVKADQAHQRSAQKNLGKASLAALLWSGLEQWGGQLFALFFYILLARLLGPDQFGLVAMAGVYIAFAQLFVNQGLATALIQRKELLDKHVDSAFWANVFVGVTLTIVSWFIADSVAALYKQPELGVVIKALCITLIFTSLAGVQAALLSRQLKFKPLAVRTLVATVVGGVVGVSMAFAGYGVWSLVAQQLISAVVRLVLLWVQSDWRPGFRFSFAALREIMPFSLNILGANLVEFGNRFSDKFIIGLFLGPTILGFYVLAYKLYVTLTVMLTGFIGQVAVSSFSAIQDDKAKVRDTYYRATRLAAFVSLPVFATVAAVAGIAFPVLLGDRWESSVPVFRVLAVAGALECVFLFNANVMIALGKPHWRFRLGALSAVLNIAGFYFAVQYGIVYVALAYVLRLLLVSPLPLYLLKMLVGISPVQYLKGFFAPLVGALGIIAASFYLPQLSTIIKLPVVLIVLFSACCVMAYLLLTLLINKPVAADLQSMGRFFKNKSFGKGNMKRLAGILFIVLGIGLAGLYYINRESQWQFSDSFVEAPSALAPYDLYDLGVAKIDADERLDIFTVNHSSRQQVLFGDGQARLMSQIGLGQLLGFPGAEAKATAPEITQPGLHIYRQNKYLHIITHELDSLDLVQPTQLKLELPWPIKVISSKNATSEQSQQAAGTFELPPSSNADTPLKMVHTIDILLEDDAEVVLTGDQDILELPHNISVADQTLRNNTFVGGSDKLSLGSSETLLWRDRHAMLWRDIDDDGDSDVYIARGGVKGQLAFVPSRIEDEFIVRQGNESRNIIGSQGILKGSCPARQSAWTDANADGALDLHVSCGRAGEDRYPDELYIKESDGYTNIADAIGLDYAGVSVLKWADVDIDGDLDLFTAQSNTLNLYINNDGEFSKTVLDEKLLTKPTHIIVADLDHDADLDAFVVQRTGSQLVLNNNNTFEVQAPETLGLPSRLRTATVVDVDNDGYTDMHFVPGGLYTAVAAGQYEASEQLADPAPIDTVSEALCAWLDQDMNGLLEPTCAVRMFPHKVVRVWKKIVEQKNDTRYWVTRSASNTLPSQNWLQIDLRAGPQNAEGIGAVVRLETKDRTQIATVGQSDTAHYSQGHYRLYFGLGEQTQIQSLTVHWPGGTQQQYSVTDINTLVELSQSSTDNP